MAMSVVQLDGSRRLSGRPYKEDPATFRTKVMAPPMDGGDTKTVVKVAWPCESEE